MKQLVYGMLGMSLLLSNIQAESDIFAYEKSTEDIRSCDSCMQATMCSNCACDNLCRTTFVPGDHYLSRRPSHIPVACQSAGVSGNFYATYTYQRSFDNDQLARCLLGSSVLLFQGSQVTGRSAAALLADNVGLPVNFSGTLALDPLVQSNIIDFGLELRSGSHPDWYVQLLAPIQHVNWQLRPCETDAVAVDTLETDYQAGYMSAEATAVGATTLQEALSGLAIFGDMKTPWSYGKFSFCQRTASGLANLEARLGWDFWHCDSYHMGAYALVQAPTGTSLNPDYFFNPVIGGGKHWKLGGGVTAHYDLWTCGDDQGLMAYFEGNVGHMFKKTQQRSFEFANHGCCMSRYALLKVFDEQNNFTGSLVNGIDFATRNAQVKMAAEGECKLELEYRNGGWKAGVGYNFYGRSHEEIQIDCAPLCAINSANSFGFKGCSGDYYYEYTTEITDDVEVTTDVAPTAQLLNATQNGSTMCMCGSVDAPVEVYTIATADENGSVGVNYTQPGGANAVTAGAMVGNLAIAESSDPAYLFGAGDASVLDAQSGAMPTILSHTVYGRLSYQADWANLQPIITIGGEGEFRQSNRCCTISRWGLWLGGSVNF
jgi:hypothetical protein